MTHKKTEGPESVIFIERVALEDYKPLAKPPPGKYLAQIRVDEETLTSHGATQRQAVAALLPLIPDE